MKKVIIDFSRAGTVAIEAVGFKGSGCTKATEHVEIALGGQGAKSRKKKPEFFQSPASTIARHAKLR